MLLYSNGRNVSFEFLVYPFSSAISFHVLDLHDIKTTINNPVVQCYKHTNIKLVLHTYTEQEELFAAEMIIIREFNFVL